MAQKDAFPYRKGYDPESDCVKTPSNVAVFVCEFPFWACPEPVLANHAVSRSKSENKKLGR
jgi:hypothetical protein